MKVIVPNAKRSKATLPVHGPPKHPESYSYHPDSPLRIAQLPKEGVYTVLDNGCDQAILGKGWSVVKVHDDQDPVIDHDGNTRVLCDCIATVLQVLGTRKRLFIARVNNAIYDDTRQESLLPPDQIRWKKNTSVDDTAIAHGGKQQIEVGDTTLDLLWDGKTFFFVHTKSTKSDQGSNLVDMTSRKKYEPTLLAAMLAKEQGTPVCNPDLELIEPEYPGGKFSIACRRSYLFDATGHKWNADQLAMWEKRLCASKEVVKKTFLATTQLVPSLKHENETFPKDYHVTRFPMLSNRRLREKLYADIVEWKEGKRTFYGFLAYSEKSKITFMYPMGKKASSHKALEAMMSFCRDFGIPSEIRSDYANNMSQSVAWQRFCRLMQVDLGDSEPHKHNQNVVERAWQDIQRKGHYVEMTSSMPRDKKLSLYTHLCDVHNHTALESIGWKTPMEIVDGDTPDLSFLRFYFWEPVWYLEGNARFPQRKWLKGRFEGIAWTTGDQMCYLVAPDNATDKNRRVTRSIVISRHPDEKAPHELNKQPSDFYFPTPLRTPLPPLAGRKRTADEADAPTERSEQAEERNPETDEESEETPIRDSDAATREPGTVGPEEQRLREEYLQVAEEERERYMELTTPPANVLDHGDVLQIKRHRKGQKGNSETYTFTCEMSAGKDLKVSLADMKVDCPSMLAKYITSNESLRKDKTLMAWAKPILKCHDKIVKIAQRMERRFGINIGGLKEQLEVPMSRARRIKCRRRVMRQGRTNVNTDTQADIAIVKIAQRMERRFGINIGGLKEQLEVPMSRARRIKCRRRVMRQGRTNVNTDTQADIAVKEITKSKSPNKRKANVMGSFKYGVYVPKNVEDALRQDELNGNNLWKESMIAELSVIQQYATFKVLPDIIKKQTLKSHQFAPLRMIFTVKEDLRRKSRLIIGGHVIDSGTLDTFSSNMRGISARILMLIASANNLDVLSADIKAAYLNAKTDLDVVVKMGKEFTILDPAYKTGGLATVEKSLYGLSTSAKKWREALSNTIRTLGFEASRDDPDVWYSKTSYGFEYLGTHTDDLICVSKDPQAIMDKISKIYDLSKVEEPRFHLGCDYEKDPDGIWKYGTKTHVAEAIKKVETIIGKQLGLETIPMSETCKPEIDESPLLDTAGHRIYQQLIGIAQWLVTIGRFDLGFALNSLSRFSSAPRENHLEYAIKMFKYLKRYPIKWIRLDPGEHTPGGELIDPLKGMKPEWHNYYHHAKEILDPNHPLPYKGSGFKALGTTVYFDSNFAHDERTRRSISGTITYVGNCPVAWSSTRQGAIATGTYGAELCAAKQGVEEAISIRCILRSFGVPLAGKTELLGDNLGSLTSATTPGSPCKKKHSSVAYHFVRECNAAGIVNIMKVHTDFNLSDGQTKALGKNKFHCATGTIFARRHVLQKGFTERRRRG